VGLYLNDGAEPAGVANVLEAHGTRVHPLAVVGVGRVAPDLRVAALQAGLVLRDAGLQDPTVDGGRAGPRNADKYIYRLCSRL